MVTYFCPACWRPVPAGLRACPACGADLAALDAAPFPERLARALWSPEPDTARRAAEILGLRGEARAVPELERRLAADPDPYLAADIATALGRIGGHGARRVLRRLLSADASVVVKAAAARALCAAGPGEEAEATR